MKTKSEDHLPKERSCHTFILRTIHLGFHSITLIFQFRTVNAIFQKFVFNCGRNGADFRTSPTDEFNHFKNTKIWLQLQLQIFLCRMLFFEKKILELA